MTIIRLNALRYQQDPRDHRYKLKDINLPNEVDLRSFDSRIEDQGFLGSCTAYAVTSAYEVMTKILYPEKFSELSELFVYYHSRLFSDELSQDSGSYIRDSLKSVKNYGVCKDLMWPYLIENFSKQPPPQCYLDAARRKIIDYNILFTNNEIQEILANKQPVILGMEIFYEFFNITKDDPVVKMPGYFAHSSGYHAVSIMGYSTENSSFLIKNSWGNSWGDNGYAWLPYEYVEIYSTEKWCFTINSQSTIS